MTTVAQARIAAVRAIMKGKGIDGLIVPLTDEHMSEYVGAYARRLEWLTGFKGSAGTAVILAEEAALFVDSRYTLQAAVEVEQAIYDQIDPAKTALIDWIASRKNLDTNLELQIAYDPWLHPYSWVKKARKQLKNNQVSLVALESNGPLGGIIDSLWNDQPPVPLTPLEIYPMTYAGVHHHDKLKDLGEELSQAGIDCCVISALDSSAWLMNIRAQDIDYTPVARCFVIAFSDGRAKLFCEPEKMTDQVREQLTRIDILPRESFIHALSELKGKRVLVDPEMTASAVFELLDASSAEIIEKQDPCIMKKACKNPVELSGIRNCHIRDALAMLDVLQWLKSEGPKGMIDEYAVMDRLLEQRSQQALFRDQSFGAITGVGANGALPHYRTTVESNRKLQDGDLFLFDSGGQYWDGTTDVTRTIAIGEIVDEEGIGEHFTRVLQGHIAINRLQFPEGTSGQQIDSIARLPQWLAGYDYGHGTGHGVGCCLSVHEGPQRIAKTSSPVALKPGMVLSNEPGYYEPKSFGIRTENLIVVQKVPDRPGWLCFEQLTWLPYDRDLIRKDALTMEEIAWIDSYHAEVRAKLRPLVEDAAVATWLEEATEPLS